MIYHYDDTVPRRIERFCAEFLVHTKGEHANKPFVLLPWQMEIIRDIFGTLKEDGTRRYRQSYIEIPRKQGKSTLCAAIALYELLFGDEGGECFICANSREQARILFSIASDMVKASKRITPLITVYKNSLYNPKKKSTFKVLSRDAVTALGVNASLVIMDELLGAPDDSLYQSMATSMGARKQPLMFSITTAGTSRVSFCYQLHEYTEKVMSGVLKDDTFYGKIYGIKEGEDWTNPEVWKRCNPSFDHTVSLEFLQTEFNRAKEFPLCERSFRQLYLNEWLSSDTSWLKDEVWMLCADENLKLEDFKGETCYAGADLSSTLDLTAVVLCFYRDSTYYLFPFAFCPEDNVDQRARKDKAPYQLWADQGLLKATPGNVIDHDYIIKLLVDIGKDYPISEITFDRYMASYVIQKVQEEGFNVTLFNQSYTGMNPAVKMMEKLVIGRSLLHSGHSVMRWNMSNVILKMDPNGNCKLDKGKTQRKIDIVVASLMALERCVAANITVNNNVISWS